MTMTSAKQERRFIPESGNPPMMGLFRIRVEVSDPADIQMARAETVEALVDTGATYAALPADVLRRLGIAKLGKMAVTLADGRTAERDYGVALLRIDSRAIGATILWGEERDLAVLGSTVLEQAGLGVDPVRKRLVPVQAIQA